MGATVKSKEGTGRVVVARELNITNSYTMEASFCGANFGRYNSCHFSTMHYEQVGRSFCETIFDFCDPNQTRARAALHELQMLYPAEKSEEGDADSDWEDDGSKRSKKKKEKDRDKTAKKSKSSTLRRVSGGAKKESSMSAAQMLFHEPRFSRGK